MAPSALTRAMLQRAQSAVRDHLRDTPLSRRRPRIAAPLLVTTPAGSPAGWFVGVVVDDRLLGFVQFDSAGDVLRTSWFPMRGGGLEGLPAVDSWLDPVVIGRRAATVLRRGESHGTPRLSYDRDPSRLVWIVPVTALAKAVDSVAVAGDAVYRLPSREGETGAG